MSKDHNMKLTDIIELSELQQLQDSFALVHDVASVITGPDGENITRQSNHSKVCRLVGSTPTGELRCTESNRYLGKKSAESMKPEIMRCLSCGFWEASAPIIIDGQYVASWHISHKADGVDEESLEKYAYELGLDPEELSGAFQKQNSVTEQQFKQIAELLWIIAKQLSGRSYLAYKAVFTLKEQMRLHRKLLEQQRLLRKLSSEYLIAEERAKREIAISLHDTVGHSLIALKRDLSSYVKHHPDAHSLEPESKAIDEIIRQTRELTFQLGNPILYDFGMSAALDALADDILRPMGIELTIRDDCPDLQVEESHRVLLYTMLRELLYNVVKHANASKVAVLFYRKGSNFIAEVCDDGVGFCYDKKLSKS